MQTISRQELEGMNESGGSDFVLINVLSPEAFNQSHIRTSINVPLEDSDFEQTVSRVAGDKDRSVVVYCGSFDCDASRKAAHKLDEAGFSHVYDYEGGNADWQRNH